MNVHGRFDDTRTLRNHDENGRPSSRPNDHACLLAAARIVKQHAVFMNANTAANTVAPPLLESAALRTLIVGKGAVDSTIIVSMSVTQKQ